jgi:hypothetical protein
MRGRQRFAAAAQAMSVTRAITRSGGGFRREAAETSVGRVTQGCERRWWAASRRDANGVGGLRRAKIRTPLVGCVARRYGRRWWAASREVTSLLPAPCSPAAFAVARPVGPIALRSPAARKPRVYIHVHPLGGAKHASLKGTAEPLGALLRKGPSFSKLPEGGTSPRATPIYQWYGDFPGSRASAREARK